MPANVYWIGNQCHASNVNGSSCDDKLSDAISKLSRKVNKIQFNQHYKKSYASVVANNNSLKQHNPVASDENVVVLSNVTNQKLQHQR